MEDAKKNRIIDAAIKVFAEKSYQYAAISDIAREAGVSTGFMYSYFENKLDLLLSIILTFWKKINHLNNTKLQSVHKPIDKIYAILENFETMLLTDENTLYLVKVLSEGLPHIVMIRDKKLQKKRREIIMENKKIIGLVDDVIRQGQQEGVFDCTLKPAVMRQVLCGTIERVVYGLFYTAYSGEDIGYNADDAHQAAVRLIETFMLRG